MPPITNIDSPVKVLSCPASSANVGFASTQLGLTTKDHMQGRGRYWFAVRCGDLSRGDHLYIDADPGPGGIVYCTDETGVIYGLPFKNGAVCGR
jgi:hypothetical protein